MQTDRLLKYLKEKGSINPLTSWQVLGIYRLSAVVFLLRGDGHNIITDFIIVHNQFGEECRVANYRYVAPVPQFHQESLF